MYEAPLLCEAAPAVEFARCFLRMANLPNLAIDRLGRYEAALWRQAGRILLSLDAPGSAQTPGAKAPFLCRQRARTVGLRA